MSKSITIMGDDIGTLIKDNEANVVSSWRDIPKKPDQKLKVAMPNQQNIDNLKWSEENEATIIKVLYSRYGNGSCKDFEDIAHKFINVIKRVYDVDVTKVAVIEKLTKYVTVEYVDSLLKTSEKQDIQEKVKVEVVLEEIPEIKECTYKYYKGLDALTKPVVELCNLSACKKLCFSSNKNEFHLSCLDKKASCDFSESLEESEKMAFTILKEQLKDDLKALKLVILLRGSKKENESNIIIEKIPETKIETPKKGRKKKEIPNV